MWRFSEEEVDKADFKQEEDTLVVVLDSRWPPGITRRQVVPWNPQLKLKHKLKLWHAGISGTTSYSILAQNDKYYGVTVPLWITDWKYSGTMSQISLTSSPLVASRGA